MPTRIKQPCGSWPSPLSAADIASSSLRLGQTAVDGDVVYWLEGRPAEAGRSVLMSFEREHGISEVLPQQWNVRSRAHEYGGGAFAVDQGYVCFVHDGDRRLYLTHGNQITPLTNQDNAAYADMVFDLDRHRIICVRERYGEHTAEAVSELIAVSMDGSGDIVVLHGGHDFYSNPRLSRDGSRLCWLQWDHPYMPWDSTELSVASISHEGLLETGQCVAGSNSESVFQPQWHSDGKLYFVSDRSGWWNLYCWNGEHCTALYPLEAEFGLPQWVFGMSTYAFINDDCLLCTYCIKGIWKLATLQLHSGKFEVLDLPYTSFNDIAANVSAAIMLASGPMCSSEVVYLENNMSSTKALRRSLPVDMDKANISVAQAIEFIAGSNETVHGFYYPPCNKDYAVPDDERPPLIVKSHGGPTGATVASFDPKIQYWTSRGFAVLDVNYRGSTGFGRVYHEKLNGHWGIVDVEDCIAGARYLVDQGLVDGNRLIITGSSAGGFTTLCALTFHNVFAAGASYYGIGDLEALLNDTHKFESHYFDTLIAPYQGNEALYRQRSPLYSADQLSCPVIFMQGSEDKVVPPQQAQAMVSALEKKGVAVSYMLFEGEQHGFRRAETIQKALEAELSFYGKHLGFEPNSYMELKD